MFFRQREKERERPVIGCRRRSGDVGGAFEGLALCALVVSAPVHVGEFFETWPPVIEVVVVLLSAAGGVK